MCSSAVYGGTFNLFYKTLHEMGIDCTFVSPNCTEDELNAAFRENTRCVFAETLTNPSLVVTDLEMFANAAHAHGVLCRSARTSSFYLPLGFVLSFLICKASIL